MSSLLLAASTQSASGSPSSTLSKVPASPSDARVHVGQKKIDASAMKRPAIPISNDRNVRLHHDDATAAKATANTFNRNDITATRNKPLQQPGESTIGLQEVSDATCTGIDTSNIAPKKVEETVAKKVHFAEDAVPCDHTGKLGTVGTICECGCTLRGDTYLAISHEVAVEMHSMGMPANDLHNQRLKEELKATLESGTQHIITSNALVANLMKQVDELKKQHDEEKSALATEAINAIRAMHTLKQCFDEHMKQQHRQELGMWKVAPLNDNVRVVSQDEIDCCRHQKRDESILTLMKQVNELQARNYFLEAENAELKKSLKIDTCNFRPLPPQPPLPGPRPSL